MHRSHPSDAGFLEHGETQCEHHQAYSGTGDRIGYCSACGLSKCSSGRARPRCTGASTSSHRACGERRGLSLCLAAFRGSAVAVPVTRESRQCGGRRLRRDDLRLAGYNGWLTGDDAQGVGLRGVDSKWVFIGRGACRDTGVIDRQ